MKYVKKMKLNASEVAQIRRELGEYIWVAVDIDRNAIAAGDEYLADLRESLIYKFHCRAKNIFGIGVDLRTGEIYYAPVINRRNKIFREHKCIPKSVRRRIETMIGYFFEDFAPFRPTPRRKNRPRDLPASSC